MVVVVVVVVVGGGVVGNTNGSCLQREGGGGVGEVADSEFVYFDKGWMRVGGVWGWWWWWWWWWWVVVSWETRMVRVSKGRGGAAWGKWRIPNLFTLTRGGCGWEVCGGTGVRISSLARGGAGELAGRWGCAGGGEGDIRQMELLQFGAW